MLKHQPLGLRRNRIHVVTPAGKLSRERSHQTINRPIHCILEAGRERAEGRRPLRSRSKRMGRTLSTVSSYTRTPTPLAP